MPKRRRLEVPLSRERIISEALGVLDEQGLGALSLRQVAGRLGVHVTSLYNHVSSMQDLLNGVVDRVLSTIEIPDIGLPWEQRIIVLATGLYRALAAHPDLVGVLASEGGRPGAAAVVAGMEASLVALAEAGLQPADQVSAYRGLISVVLGLVLAHTRGSLVSLEEADATWRGEVPRDWGAQAPTLTRLASQFLSTRPEDDLVFILGAFVAGIRSHSAGGCPSR